VKVTFDSEGVQAARAVRRHPGGNDFVSSSVLSPKKFSAPHADTFPVLSRDVPSADTGLEWWPSGLACNRMLDLQIAGWGILTLVGLKDIRCRTR
jgi:hypothetical protein